MSKRTVKTREAMGGATHGLSLTWAIICPTQKIKKLVLARCAEWNACRSCLFSYCQRWYTAYPCVAKRVFMQLGAGEHSRRRLRYKRHIPKLGEERYGNSQRQISKQKARGGVIGTTGSMLNLGGANVGAVLQR